MKHPFLDFLKPLIFCLSVFSIQSTFAQSSGGQSADRFYFEETFFPVYVSKNDAATGVTGAGGSTNQNVPTESGLGYDARTTFGYVWRNFLFGLTYNMYSVKTKRSATVDFDQIDTSTEKSEFGPTLGYFLGNWRFALTFFMSATKKATQKYTSVAGVVLLDDTYKNTGGSGYQLAFGYDFNLGGGFGISPTLIYRNVTYSKQSLDETVGSSGSYASTSLQTKAIDSELKPMITVSYSF